MYSNVIQSDLTGKEKAHLYFIMTYAKGDTSVITFQALQNYMGHIGNYPKERTRKILRRLKEKGYIINFSDDFQDSLFLVLASHTLLYHFQLIALAYYNPILINQLSCNLTFYLLSFSFYIPCYVVTLMYKSYYALLPYTYTAFFVFYVIAVILSIFKFIILFMVIFRFIKF